MTTVSIGLGIWRRQRTVFIKAYITEPQPIKQRGWRPRPIYQIETLRCYVGYQRATQNSKLRIVGLQMRKWGKSKSQAASRKGNHDRYILCDRQRCHLRVETASWFFFLRPFPSNIILCTWYAGSRSQHLLLALDVFSISWEVYRSSNFASHVFFIVGCQVVGSYPQSWPPV